MSSDNKSCASHGIQGGDVARPVEGGGSSHNLETSSLAVVKRSEEKKENPKQVRGYISDEYHDMLDPSTLDMGDAQLIQDMACLLGAQ